MVDLFLNFIVFLYNLSFQNFGLAIIVLAVLSRIVFFPMQKSMLKNQKKMQELAPKLKELKDIHKGDAKALQQAQLDLYKSHGINPAAGCLPMLLQLVIFMLLYQALYKSLNHGLNTNFLVWDLAKPDIIHLPISQNPIPFPGILVILSALSQYAQTLIMMPTPVPVKKDDKPKEVEEKKEFADEFTSASQSMSWMFPLMFLLFGTQWPSALALYWSVSTVIAIVQQYQVTGLGGLKKYMPVLLRFTARQGEKAD